MKGYITASVILGAAAIFSSLIISGNISFKDEHIIQLSGGAIKLGDVYKENKLISAKIIFPDNSLTCSFVWYLLSSSSAGFLLITFGASNLSSGSFSQ